MKLLVSVACPADASAAVSGGADLIDAKDPLAGALGAVTQDVLMAIHAAVAGARPVSAALGDAIDEATTERAVRRFAQTGATFVKVGFAGITSAHRVEALIAAAVRGAATARCGVVVVAYADARCGTALPPSGLIEIAARAAASGVLLDTSDKQGPGLLELMTPRALEQWIGDAHAANLFAAAAGKLRAGDLSVIRDVGADIAGVRGAACEGGRTGSVTDTRVRFLQSRAASVALESALLV